MKKFLLSIFCLFSLVSFATAEEATLSFADKANRTALDTNHQVWEQNGITLTNNKGASTTNVADYSNPARFYKSSQLIIETTKGMSKIVFKCTESKYTTALVSSIGGSATSASNEVTVELNGETSYTIESLTGGQVRMNSLTVTFVEVAEAEVATPTFSVEAGTKYNPFSVEITAEEGATIYYTLDGTEPTEESAEYTEAIAFNEFGTKATLKAVACIEGEWSNVATANYSLEVAAPAFSVKGGVYTKLSGETALKFTCETEGATIYYNNRGGDPKTEGSKSYGSLSVLSTAEVKAVAYVEVDGEKIYSGVVSEKYYISPVKPYEKATEFVAGSYLIASNNMVATPLAETSNYGRLSGTEVTANGKFIETNEFYSFKFTEVEGGYNIQDTFGRYIYATMGSESYYNTVNVGDETKIDPTTDAAIWTVSIAEDGKATITNALSGYTFNYSSSYKNFDTQASNAVLPSLYKLGEYPTMTVTPANWETIPAFEKVTITCESGIQYNETEENYPYYTIGWDNTPYEFDNVVTVGDNTIELTFNKPIEDNGDYRVVLPAGLFTLAPNGLAMPSAKTECTYTVENLNVLEVAYANPDNGSTVKSIEYLYFEFNQNIVDNVSGAVITNENGDEFPLTVTYTDGWGEQCPYNALCLKAAEPITTPGVYTFVLKKQFVCAEANANVTIAEDLTYTFTIAESLKITNITPANGAEVEAIEDILIEFNKEITCMAEAFYMTSDNGAEYYLTPSFNDKDGNELPYNSIRIVAETPITAAGTYTLYIEDYNIGTTDWMNMEILPAQTLTFTIPGVAAPLAVVSQTPAADEEVESFSAITFEFNKDIEFIQAAGGTGGTTGGTGGTTGGTSGPAQYIKLKDANNGVAATYWVSAATIEGATVTFVAEMNKVISTPGTYTFVIPAGLIKATDGEEFAGETFTFTVVEPTAIEGVEAEVENNAIYDLSGRKIETITKGGIYIIGGKKVYVK